MKSPQLMNKQNHIQRYLAIAGLLLLLLVLVGMTIIVVLGNLGIIAWSAQLNNIYIGVLVPVIGLLIPLIQWIHSFISKKPDTSAHAANQGVVTVLRQENSNLSVPAASDQASQASSNPEIQDNLLNIGNITSGTSQTPVLKRLDQGVNQEDPHKTRHLSPDDKEQREPASPFWNVLYRRNPFFTNRELLLSYLYEQLEANKQAALTQPRALSGLGGIGKTQTALEYAYRLRDKYRAIFWARAASRDTLFTDFVGITRLLDLPEKDLQDQTLVIAAMKRWFANNTGWLLIMDNADDLGMVSEFLPGAGYGHILLTTRSQATGSIATNISVEKMGLEEGALLLLRRAKLLALDEVLIQADEQSLHYAQQIVSAMDGLPLALDQAGAYIEETGCGLAEYLDLSKQRRKELFNRKSKLPSDYPYTVATTWSISFQQVEAINPAAADLLCLCAFLHPDAIPERVILKGITVLHKRLKALANDPFLFNEAIEVLRTFSLVRRNRQSKILTVHRLVQVILKDEMSNRTLHQWIGYAIQAVNAAFPPVRFQNWQECESCLPHALLCIELIEQYKIALPEAARLLHHSGWFLREYGEYQQAEPILQQALVIAGQVFGAVHPVTSIPLHTLAHLYMDRGQYDLVKPLLQQVLSIRENALGSNHHLVANALHSFGQFYQAQGQYGQSEAFFQQALSLSEEVLGPRHRDVATTLCNLTEIYQDWGQYSLAERLLQRALDIDEKTFGSENPETAVPLSNLGQLYVDQGQYALAERMLQRALAIRKKTLGVEHPETFTTVYVLVQLYLKQGRFDLTRTYVERDLSLCEKAFGPNHPSTAASLCNAALFYQSQGLSHPAEEALKRALAIYEKKLGQSHPDVATTLQVLAQLYQGQGNYAQSELLLKRALGIRKDSSDTERLPAASILSSLATLYQAQGQYDQAEPLLQKALAICESVLNPDHPLTAVAVNNLATLYQAQGQYNQAEPLLHRVLAIREEALGPDHPLTVVALNNLASLYQAQGRYDQAEPLLHRVLAIHERVLSSDHPLTAVVLNNLASLYQAQGRYDQAEAFLRRTLSIREHVFGLDHPSVALTRYGLVSLYRAQKLFSQAEALLRQIRMTPRKTLASRGSAN